MSMSACLGIFLLLGVASVVAKGDLVEWPVNLFDIANANANAECESVELLKPPGHYAGYFPLSDTEDGHLSYMYFENRLKDPDAPLVFWTNGGPGCSAFFGLFMENGPYTINEDLSLCWNKNGWDIGHNALFVEQPVGVGFSYSRAQKDRVFSEDRVGDDMVAFFHAFIKKHPELAKKDLYVTGESFAGHYLPNIAQAILDANAKQSNPHLNLKGVFMVNPWISPAALYHSYPVYAHQEKLITKGSKDSMLSSWGRCEKALKACDMKLPFIGTLLCTAAYSYCQTTLFQPVLLLHPTLNYYDIRRMDCTTSMCYDMSRLGKFLNNPEVKAAIGAKKDIKWDSCSRKIRFDLAWDVATDSSDVVTSLLESNLPVTVVVGDRDFICNYVGNEAWTDVLKWNKHDQWTKTERHTLDSQKGGGYVRQLAPFSFVKVEESGHMVPMDQPALALELLTTFTRGKTYPTTDSVQNPIT